MSHNFLFSPPYERMLADLERGVFGRLDQVDVIWNRPLGQIQGGPFGGWLFNEPRNVLLEVGPHSCAHIVHLLGGLPDRIESEGTDPVRLPTGHTAYRRWEAHGTKGRTTIQLRWSFGDGYPEHYLHIRGTSASAIVDFDLDTYTVREPFRDLLDVDRFAMSVRAAKDSAAQADRHARLVRAREGGAPVRGRALPGQHHPRGRGLLPRTAGRARQARFAPARDRGRAARRDDRRQRPPGARGSGPPGFGAAVDRAHGDGVQRSPVATVLVLGGTGFIGRALVRRLRSQGYGVRVLAR